MNTFGFIGTGNMGGALARAVAKSVAPNNIFLSDACSEKAAALAKELGCSSCAVEDLVKNCDFIYLGVKPQVMASMLESIRPVLETRKTGFVLVSMAAGVEIASLRRRECAPGGRCRLEGSYVRSRSGICSAGKADRCRQRLVRLRSRFCQPLYRSAGRRCRYLRSYTAAGNGVCLPDPHRHCKDAATDRDASRCAEGCRLLPRWLYHCRCRCAGSRCFPGYCHGCSSLRLRENLRIGKITKYFF